jgi:predicted Zn-dependent peptidase
VIAPRQVLVAFCLVAWLSASLTLAGCRKQVTASLFQLDSGLRAEIVATPRGHRAALTLLFDVGADNDPAGRSGMSHLVGYLMRGQAGSDWQVHCGADYTALSVVVPAGRLPDEIETAALRIGHPIVREGDLASERPRLLRDLAADERDPATAAKTRAAEAVRPSRGGGLRGGVPAEIEAITLPEVEAFQRMHFGAATLRVLATGLVDMEETTKRIKAGFADVPAGKAPPARPPAASTVTGTLVMGDAPTAAALAVPVPAPKDPLYPAFLVLAARVTAADPARTWQGDFAPLARPDVLFVTTTLAANQPAEPAAAQMRTAVSAVVTAPLAPDEIKRAIEAYGPAMGMVTPSPDAWAATPAELGFAAGRRAQLGVDGKALAQAVASVTPEQLAAAAKLFDAKSSAAVIAGGK